MFGYNVYCMPVERKTDAVGENNSLHATKYKFDQAIGDLIDNSIDAGSKNVQVMIFDQDYSIAYGILKFKAGTKRIILMV